MCIRDRAQAIRPLQLLQLGLSLALVPLYRDAQGDGLLSPLPVLVVQVQNGRVPAVALGQTASDLSVFQMCIRDRYYSGIGPGPMPLFCFTA